MKLLYNLGIHLFSLAAIMAAPFNPKARLLVNGRKGWKKCISEKIKPGDRTIWMHCASLGEFEQGRPVLEEIRKQFPERKILLTFFSPSGYEVRKNYSGADCICYLPSDTAVNAREFLKLVNPGLVIFVKYEFWNNFISELHRRATPIFLISAIFRPDQHFFRWYGGFFREMLKKFDRIFVQEKRSVDLLSGIGINNVVLAGDTRYDRVVRIAGEAKDIPVLESFRGGEKLFLAGSSWPPDEEIISRYINMFPDKMKWVFAPHEIERPNIERLQKLFRVKCVRFSQYDESCSDARVLIMDNIGMLSSAYRYASVAALGGGFGKGIHNVLEPACWGIPVMFGPRHEKFREALELIKEKGAFTFDSFDRFQQILDNLLSDEVIYLESAKAASFNVKKNTGATKMIVDQVILKI